MPEIRATSHLPAPGTAALRVGPRGRHLVDVTVFFAPTSGGVRRYLVAKHEWLRRHSRLKHTVLVPGSHDGGLPYDVMSFGSPAIPFGRGYRVPLRLRAFREQLARLAPDLVEVGDPYHLAGESLRIARQRGAAAVAFCHSDVVGLADAWLGRWAGRRAQQYLARLYGGFDLVLAPSRVVAARLARLGLDNVHVQPLGVDVTTFHPSADDPELRTALGIPSDVRLLVFAGRLSPEKRAGDLLAAMRRLGRRHHLLLVGDGRTRRLQPNVTSIEYQRDAALMARLFASCDAFVHAGDQETFGLVVLEAMACGLPVIAARAGALPELVDDTVGATFAPRDVRDLAATITHLFDRDTAALRQAARRRAEAHSWDAAFTRLLGRYALLLGPPSGRVQTIDSRELARVG